MDKVGKLPKPKTKQGVLVEILKITLDDRSHVLLQDQCAWLELKIEAIARLVKHGLKLGVIERKIIRELAAIDRGEFETYEEIFGSLKRKKKRKRALKG